MVIGALLAAAVGALLAIPALRLGGIYLALATLAFALMFDSVIVPLDWVERRAAPAPTCRRPEIGPIDFGNNKTLLPVLVAAVLAIVGVVVILVRRGHDRAGTSTRCAGSEVAAASIGISRSRSQIVAFALSAGIAGLGGGLLAMPRRAGELHRQLPPFLGLVWIVLVVTLGSRTVEGAIKAGARASCFCPRAS